MNRSAFLRFAIGPFPVLGSLLIHAGIVAASMLAVRWFDQPPVPPGAFEGGGGEVGLVPGANSPSASPALPSALSSLPPAGAIRVESFADGQEASSDADPLFSHDRTLSNFNADADDAAGAPLIGVGLEQSPPAPPFHSERSSSRSPDARPAAGRRSGGAPSGAASRATVGGGGDSHAGLPGALLGQGLPTPDYPAEARRRGQQGLVRIAIEVRPDGAVGDIRLVSDPGYPLLRDSALSAARKLRQFRFIPARRFGSPVRDDLIIPYNFILR